MTRFLSMLVFALGVMTALPAAAVNPDEVLADPALEARAREISKDLRCLVCQNQSIDDSDAQLAKDLRVLVRERLVAGDGNQDVIDYVVSRYGDFVLLKPRFAAKTWILWFAAPLTLLLGVGVIIMFYRRRRPDGSVASPTPDPLSDDEARRVAALMNDEDAR